MQDFRGLKVWQKAHQLTLAVYRATTSFPKEEMYGLTAQIRRSAASIPSNIAEGCGRNTAGDMARFLQVALGSGSELEYQLLLAHELGFLREKEYSHLSSEATQVKRMLASLIRKLKTDN